MFNQGKLLEIIINTLVFAPPTNLIMNDCNKQITKIIEHSEYQIPYILSEFSNATKYMVFAHGRATNIYELCDFTKKISNTLNINVLSFEYPGFLNNYKGNLSEKSCCDSIKLVIDFLTLTLNIDKSDIYLVGASLGTGIVADFVSKHSWITPIMLISPFTTIMNVVNDKNKTQSPNQSKLFDTDMFTTIEKINDFKCPTQLVHSTKDTAIDISHSREIYKKLSVECKLEPCFDDYGEHTQVLNNIPIDVWSKFLNL